MFVFSLYFQVIMTMSDGNQLLVQKIRKKLTVEMLKKERIS